ncbi:thioredoxin family protein [Elusimicrobiota bacterium]
MAVTQSISVALGSEMPDFELEDSRGKSYTGRELYGKKGLLVVFTCNHCPYAKAIWSRLIRLAEHAKGLGIPTVAINPNTHPDYPEDAPDRMEENTRELGIDFPYLVDKTQGTAKDFKAQCTPDLYLFDASRKLVYHGRLDDCWQRESSVKRQELREAVEDLAAGRPVHDEQCPSLGCSIKWR